MLKTAKQFYSFMAGLVVVLGLALLAVFVAGDVSGQPLKAYFSYQPEAENGLPRLSLRLEGTNLPEKNSVEAAFSVNPPLVGDLNWEGTTLLFTPTAPLASNTTYQVRLRGGLKLAGGGRLDYGQYEWNFHTRLPRITYLKREGQAVNLWIAGIDGTEARRLTGETERQVLEYSVSPGGERIVYSLQEANGREVSLWLVNTGNASSEDTQPRRLVFEPNIQASSPKWSPGGDLIAYERRLLFEKDGFAPAQLWLIRSDGTSLPPLYGGAERVGVYLSWSAGGDKVVFWEPRKEALGVFNFSGEPTWVALPGIKLAGLSLSPDGREVILARYDYSGVVETIKLVRLTLKGLESRQIEPLNLDTPPGYSDSQPAWSPDGKLVAFLRQTTGPGTARLGRIWLFDPQNLKTWPLVAAGETEPNLSQGNFAWSFDTQKVVFERYQPGVRLKNTDGEIWEATLDGKTTRKVAVSAFGVKWIN